MHDKQLFLISVLVSFTGLILLFFMTFLEPELSDVSSITEYQDGNKIRTKALVHAVQQRGNMTLFTLQETCSLDAVIFSPVNLTEGDCILVSGTKSTYNDQPQLIVNKIVKC